MSEVVEKSIVNFTPKDLASLSTAWFSTPLLFARNYDPRRWCEAIGIVILTKDHCHGLPGMPACQVRKITVKIFVRILTKLKNLI